MIKAGRSPSYFPTIEEKTGLHKLAEKRVPFDFR
jgi:hypothetical protein